MPELTLPRLDVHFSFVESVREFHAHGSPPPYIARLDPETLGDPAEFADYVKGLLEQRWEQTPRPAGFVPMTTLWWIERTECRTEFLARLAIRHRLTPTLMQVGGHIGYDVRPSARRQGHAGAMLEAALPIARELGIDRALITCDEDNVASRKVIEKNGGRQIAPYKDKLRFWVPT
jgi:predicted acetyltransferase